MDALFKSCTHIKIILKNPENQMPSDTCFSGILSIKLTSQRLTALVFPLRSLHHTAHSAACRHRGFGFFDVGNH